MVEPMTVEQRLTELEKEVAALKLQMNPRKNGEENWVDKISGSMKDNPAFEEAMKLAAEILRADQPKD